MDVICLGQFTADVIVRPVEKLPDRGRSKLVDRIELHNGGCACNSAITLAKLGTKVGVIGRIGRDSFGNFLTSLMRKQGIDTNGLKIDPLIPTSSTVVLVDSDGERSFLHYLGANAHLTIDDVDFDLIRKAKILHVTTFFVPKLDGKPVADILKKAKKIGVTTSLDTAWDEKGKWLDILEFSFKHIDIFLPNIEEARMITNKRKPEEISETLLSYGIKVVGLKMGSEGCYVRSADKEVFVPPVRVKVVDTTGAGDAFVAGFLTGWLKGWNLETIGWLANTTGAVCVTAMGNSGIKSLKETIEFMERAKSKKGQSNFSQHNQFSQTVD